MMYVEFMKNFLFGYSSELLAVRIILASWAQKRLIPTFYTWCTSSSWKIFISPNRVSYWLLDSFWPPEPKTFDSYFLDMMYVVFMKNFLLADWSELMAVRVISASWAQKRLISTFYTWCTSSSWKIFFSPIRANWWLLESFRPPEPKNVWFLLSRHGVRRVHEKCSSGRFERAIGCYTHFGFLTRKHLIPTF